MIEIDLQARTARQARSEIKQRWPKNDVAYLGYDEDGFMVLMSLVRGVTKGNVATLSRNRSKRPIKFTARIER